MGYPKPLTVEKDKVSNSQNQNTRQRLDRGHDDCDSASSKQLIRLGGVDYGRSKYGGNKHGENSYGVNDHDKCKRYEKSGHRLKSSRGIRDYSDDYDDDDCGPSFSEKTSRLDRNNYGKSKHGESKIGGKKHGKTSYGVSEHDKYKHYETPGHRGRSSRSTHSYADDYEDDDRGLSSSKQLIRLGGGDYGERKTSGKKPGGKSLAVIEHARRKHYKTPGHRGKSSRGKYDFFDDYEDRSSDDSDSSDSDDDDFPTLSGLRGHLPNSGGNSGYLSSLQGGPHSNAQYQSNSVAPYSVPSYVYPNPPPRVSVDAQGGLVLISEGNSYPYNNISGNPTAAGMGSVSVIGAQSYAQGQVGGQYWSNPESQPGYWGYSPTPSVAPVGLTSMTAGKQGKCCPRCGCSGHHNHW